MPGAHQLHVLLRDRGAAFRVRQVVIEVQLVGRTADDALASVPSPDGQLHGCWDNLTPCRMGGQRSTEVFLSLDRHELELEYLPLAVVFLPRVHEVEHAVVGPYALP